MLRAGALMAAALALPRWQTPPELPIPLTDLSPDREVRALPPDSIDTMMAEGLARFFPAAQLLVCREGEVFWHRAYGEAALTSLFDLASITKLFTTTALLSFIGEGLVSLDTPVALVLPVFVTLGVDGQGRRPVGETQDPTTLEMIPPEPAYVGQTVDPAQVTLRHLLTHTSGLAPWRAVFQETGPVPPPEGIAGRETRTRRQQLAVEAISTYPFAGPPESDIRHSDLGFMLLGAMASRLHPAEESRATLDEAIAARVLEPLALERTTFNPLLAGFERDDILPTAVDGRWRKRRAHGEPDDRNAAGLGGVAGHAGLFSTAHEVALFGQVWLEAALTGRMETLPVTGALMQAAVQVQADNGRVRQGLGWGLRPAGYALSGSEMGAETFGHTGYTGTTLFIDPARALTVVCLTNRIYNEADSGFLAFLPRLHDTIVNAVEWV